MLHTVLQSETIGCRLRQNASFIRTAGVPYERRKFQEAWGGAPLKNTRKWLLRLKKQSDSVQVVHATAMLSLVVDPEPIQAATCPETLQLDLYRLSKLRAEFRYLVMAATLICTAAHEDKQVICVCAFFGNMWVLRVLFFRCWTWSPTTLR